MSDCDAGIVDTVIFRLYHLRGHVPCARRLMPCMTRACCRPTGADVLDECPEHRRQVSGPGGACPNTCATHAGCRPTGADGLDECPEHRRQCQDQGEPALTILHQRLLRRIIPTKIWQLIGGLTKTKKVISIRFIFIFSTIYFILLWLFNANESLAEQSY